MMGKWARARAEAQVLGWFGLVPDFIITIDANFWVSASDAQACALIEHERYHAAQDVDPFGAPKFSKATGRPVFVIRGHDVEEFVGVVCRNGAGAAGGRPMDDAAHQKPEIARVQIAHACGTCLLRVA